jgi:ribose-phosphate pyrophosphokinase
MVVCDKQRKKANEVDAMQVIGEVDGRDVIIFDDLVDTAGTLCKAADMLKEKGAKSVRAIITHPVLSGNAYENIANSTLDELITTDTLPLKQKSDKIKVLSVADMFAKAIRKIHDNESISSLFI